MSFQRVCSLDDLWKGEMKEFELDGEEILLIRTERGEIRAIQASCPHQETPLCEGELKSNMLTCGAHFWQFDVITGKGIDPDDAKLVLFPTKIENEVIYVDVKGEK